MTKSLDQCLFSVLETMLETKLETKLGTKLETMSNSSSCRFSSVYGRQTLPTGEEAFCDNGWTVNSFLNLYLPISTNLAEVINETAVAQLSILVYRFCVVLVLQKFSESILV